MPPKGPRRLSCITGDLKRAGRLLMQPGKIKTVPSDPLNSQTPAGMHGMSFVNKGTGRHLLCSPPPCLEESGSTLQSPPASSSCSELTLRNGLSLAPNDCLFPGRHWKVKAPGLLLQCLPDRCQARSACSYSAQNLVRPSLSGIPATCPLPGSGSSTPDRILNLHSPLGSLTPSGSKRSI